MAEHFGCEYRQGPSQVLPQFFMAKLSSGREKGALYGAEESVKVTGVRSLVILRTKMWGKVGASADVAAVLAEFSSSL